MKKSTSVFSLKKSASSESLPKELSDIIIQGEIQKLKELEGETLQQNANKLLAKVSECKYLRESVAIVDFLLKETTPSKEVVKNLSDHFKNIDEKSLKEKSEKKDKTFSLDSDKKVDRNKLYSVQISTTLDFYEQENPIALFLCNEINEFIIQNPELTNYLIAEEKNDDKDKEKIKTEIAKIITNAVVKFIYSLDDKNDPKLKSFIANHNHGIEEEIEKSFSDVSFNSFADKKTFEKYEAYKKQIDNLITRVKHVSGFVNRFTIITRLILGDTDGDIDRIRNGSFEEAKKLLDDNLKNDETAVETLKQINKWIIENHPYAFADSLRESKGVKISAQFMNQNYQELKEQKEQKEQKVNQEVDQKEQKVNQEVDQKVSQEINIVSFFGNLYKKTLIENEITTLKFISAIQNEKGEFLEMTRDGNNKIKKLLPQNTKYQLYITEALKERQKKLEVYNTTPSTNPFTIATSELMPKDSIRVAKNKEEKDHNKTPNAPTSEVAPTDINRLLEKSDKIQQNN